MAEKKERKNKARHRDIVMGAIEERLMMLAPLADSPESTTVDRLFELMDELRRSLNGKQELEAE